ncbi:MAG: transposase [Kiritimatiellae bacterium]|nr:transposase [Kiritimatiellia bacterium]
MRQSRITRPGACYHVTSRCANKEFFLRGREDFALDLLHRAATFSGVELLDFALMGNHFHLLVRVPETKPVPDDELERRVRALYGEIRGDRLLKSWTKWMEKGESSRVEESKAKLMRRMYDLGEFVKTFKENFSRAFNRQTGHTGTVWETRFHSVLVATEWNALYSVGSYVAANPFVAGCCKTAANYAWSGYALAKRGDGLAKKGIVRLVQLAQGDRLPRSTAEALMMYEEQLERRRPGTVSGRLPDGVDLATLGVRLAGGQACKKAERAYSEETALWRGGAIGSKESMVRLAAELRKPVPKTELADGLYAVRGGDRLGMPDREGPFRAAA